MKSFSDLKGKRIVDIAGLTIGSDSVHFYFSDGTSMRMYHWQNCCEHVEIVDICGDVSSLIKSEILLAECISHVNETPNGCPARADDYPSDSYTWTFYKLSTIRGSVTIRWLGESNGYYSQEVDLEFYKNINEEIDE